MLEGKATRTNVRNTPKARARDKISSFIWAYAAERVNLRNMGKTQIERTTSCMAPCICKSKKGKTIIIESRSVVAWDWELGRSLTAKGHEETF